MDDQNPPPPADTNPRQPAVPSPLEVRIAPDASPQFQAHMVRTYEKLRVTIVCVTIWFLFTMLYYRHFVGVEPPPDRNSISAYYHHDNAHWRMRDIFVAALFSVGVMLTIYQGYTYRENLALTVAGGAPIGVVTFPMDLHWPPIPDAVSSATGMAHYVCAVTFFACLAYVCLTQARETLKPLPDELAGRRKLFQNLYTVVGVLMLALPVLSFALYFLGSQDYVYSAEYTGVAMFLVYWLIKTVELRLPIGAGVPLGATPPSQPPPEANRAQWVMATCCVVAALTGIFWVYSFYTALEGDRRKAAQDAVSRIYPMDNELNHYQADNPGLRTLLRSDPDGNRWKAQKDGEIREKFRSLCSMNGNLFEYYLLIRDNIRDHPHGGDIIHAWDGYLEDVCKNSYGFRGSIQTTRGVWSPMFLEEFDKHAKGLMSADDIQPDRDTTQPENSEGQRN